jgi:CRISPR/Cas system type I-B associated protein Csh2 (Cas7 group RAMP superfamily)
VIYSPAAQPKENKVALAVRRDLQKENSEHNILANRQEETIIAAEIFKVPSFVRSKIFQFLKQFMRSSVRNTIYSFRTPRSTGEIKMAVIQMTKSHDRQFI